MVKIIILSGLLVCSTTGLLAADDIPGWTELSNLAKASIIGFLCLLLGVVVLLLLKALRDQQKLHIESLRGQHSEFISEVQSARHDYGEVVRAVRAADDSRYETLHVDLQAAIRAVSGLAVQCANAQARANNQHVAERKEDLELHAAERAEDLSSA